MTGSGNLTPCPVCGADYCSPLAADRCAEQDRADDDAARHGRLYTNTNW